MNERPPAPRGPKLGSRPVPVPMAAAGAGLLVGWVTAGLVWLGMAGCDAWRDTPSCGGAVGYAMVLTVLVLAWIAGRLLLGFAAVPDALMVSFLGVGIAMITVLLFLIDDTFSVWMWLVMPVLTAVTFTLSAWFVPAAGGTSSD
jgi:hypothetical protein